jgi:hypothetical protein
VVRDGSSDRGPDEPREPAAASAPTEPAAAPLAQPAERADVRLVAPSGAREASAATRAAVSGGGPWIVRGRVLRGKSEPLARAALEARRWLDYESQGEPAEKARLASDAQGRFEWALPAPPAAAFLRLDAVMPGHVAQGTEHLVVPGEPAPEDLELRVYPLDFIITGAVRDEQGNALAGARVHGAGFEAHADAEGRYRMPAPSAYSRVFLYAEAAGSAQGRGSVQPLGPATEAQLDFTLRREFQVSGRVLDERGSPIEGATVGAFGSMQLEVTSGEDGRYLLQHIARDDGFYGVYASKPGYVMARDDVAHKQGSAAEIDLVLERGVRIEGRLVTQDGRPIPGGEPDGRLRDVRLRGRAHGLARRRRVRLRSRGPRPARAVGPPRGTGAGARSARGPRDG